MNGNTHRITEEERKEFCPAAEKYLKNKTVKTALSQKISSYSFSIHSALACLKSFRPYLLKSKRATL
jgi:hypothetical protein